MRTVRVIDTQNTYGWEHGTQFDTDDESAKRLVARGVVMDVTAPIHAEYLENPPEDDFVVTITPEETPVEEAPVEKAPKAGKAEPKELNITEEGQSHA